MTYTIERLVADPRLFEKISDEQFDRLFKVVTDMYVAMDMTAEGFECLFCIASEMRPGEYNYVFRADVALDRVLADYPPTSYLH